MPEPGHIKNLIRRALEAELEGTWFFQWYSPEELAVIYNGIGPDRFPDWLREIITASAELFEPAALIHDLEYFLGGGKTDFTAANERFRRNCDTLTRRKYPWWSPLRYILFNRARRWTNYCELFGTENYHFKTGIGGEVSCGHSNEKRPNG